MGRKPHLHQGRPEGAARIPEWMKAGLFFAMLLLAATDARADEFSPYLRSVDTMERRATLPAEQRADYCYGQLCQQARYRLRTAYDLSTLGQAVYLPESVHRRIVAFTATAIQNLLGADLLVRDFVLQQPPPFALPTDEVRSLLATYQLPDQWLAGEALRAQLAALPPERFNSLLTQLYQATDPLYFLPTSLFSTPWKLVVFLPPTDPAPGG